MELIIKPTGKCNFRCKFCSAEGLDIYHNPDVVPDKVAGLINKIKPTSIIVTGGEPLLMNPEYYYKLHDIAAVPISITSNLKDFYLNPNKWAELFREKWFRVATSFQYGNGRMWDDNTVYTEDMFLRVISKFCEVTGKGAPPFIAVIDEDNEHLAIDHVLLAKRLNTTVRLNNMLALGLQDKTYPRYKMFQIYLDIIDKDLWAYEANCIDRGISKCPRNINFRCNTCIRCCYIDNCGNMHVGICDDQISTGNEFYTEDEILGNVEYHLDVNDFITPECAYCELFRLCNGCNTSRESAKLDPEYCKEMKKLEKRLIKTGWLL